jgi:DNA polymerase alpha subunit p180 N terminal
MRRNDDFIVDDDGYGYRDHGGEIWEGDDADEDGAANKKNKKRKLDVSLIYVNYFSVSQMSSTSPTS